MKVAMESFDQIAALREREQNVTIKIREIRSEISKLDKTRRKLIRDRDKIWKAIRDLEPVSAALSAGTTPTLKNIRFLKAWGAIHNRLSNNQALGGAHQQTLYETVCEELPDLKETTFRAYLHRLKKEGRISKSSKTGRWALIQQNMQGMED